MKKFLIVIACIIVFLLAAAFIVPIVFKDDIKAAVDNALAETVDADIVWDTEDFSLSLFRNFPNATAGLNNFGIFNRAPFDGQLLFAVEALEVEVDIFSLFGDQIRIVGIDLNHPEIFIKTLEDGTANYDIMIASEDSTAVTTDTTTTAYNIGIDHWNITDGHIVYDDETIPFKLELKNVNHSGSGDFTQDEFDLNTNTVSDSVTVAFDGQEYVSNKQLDADVTLTISDEYSRYTFKENQVKINDFGLSFEGFLALLDDGSMDMDINYAARENSFKSLLSLVPGVYTEDFQGIETEGTLAFNGMVKGKYDSLSLPAFNVNLAVNDAMFKYPDLPTAVNNINMNLKVDNADGNIDNTVINLSAFHMEFGDNPMDATLLVKNLVNYDMKAALNGQLNLANLSKMFPVEGLEMRGVYNVALNAEGIYDSLNNKFPSIASTMSLKEGYIKSSELPYALEDLRFNASVNDPSGTMTDFKAVVTDFNMTMDGEPFTANLVFQNLENYTWDLSAKGGIDLEKMMNVFPIEGMDLSGNIKADLTTKGNMAALEAEQYANLPTSGSVSVSNFKYADAELPYDVAISTAQASFNPQAMNIESFNGTVGKSDMQITGSISNYIGYLFGDESQVLKGSMQFSSKLLDLNEFMTEEEEAPTVTEESEQMGVIQIPQNIDFTLNASIATVKMLDLTMKNARGAIIVKDGKANLNNLKFNLLEGEFAVNGSYDAVDIAKPKYDFKLDINSLSIAKAFQNFDVVKQYVPIADKVTGDFSTDFSINGLLDQNMMPDLATVSGSGLIEIAQAAINNSQILQKVSTLTNFNNTASNKDQFNIKDVVMSAKIEDGKLSVDPFDVNLWGYAANISGATSLDGSIGFNIKMDVPAGKLGSKFNSFISSYSGGNASESTTIPVNIGIGGTYDNPQPKLMMEDQKQQVKEAVTAKAKEDAKEAAKDLLDNVKDDKAKNVINSVLGNNKKDTTKADSTKQQLDLENAKDKIKDLFKRKKGNN